MFKTPFQYGPLTLPNNVMYASLAGCSDYPFRKITARYRPGLLFCEMVKMDALVRENPQTCRLLDYDASMHPIGAQLCGSKPEIAGEAAKRIEDLGFDLVDLNCGCPVNKVVKDGSGAALLRDPKRIGEILEEMIKAVTIPVSVKIRIGWESQELRAVEITKIADSLGVVGITIHGRTRAQGYSGKADWDQIKQCKAVAKQIRVIGNGDLFTADDVHRMFLQTGCDGVLLARGTLFRPWMMEEIAHFYSKLPYCEKSLEEKKALLLEHLDYLTAYKGEQRAVTSFRGIAPRYLRDFPNASQLRYQLSRATSVNQVLTSLRELP